MTTHPVQRVGTKTRLLGVTLLALTGYAPLAQANSNYLDLSLEELLDVPINVASRTALSQRESPGILTVIYGDEIRRSGARNLEDVLRQVPGFDFRLIGANVLGLGMRGHIGSDGRVLLQVDGIEVNEHRFGTAQFGQGFPMESIKRIEILRGSALAMYGGTAEMGVINIITRDANDLKGGELVVGAGYAGNARSSEYAGLMAGGTVGNDVQLSAALHDGRAQRSEATFYGPGGTSYDMSATDEIYPRYANLALSAGGLNVRYLRDASSLNSRFALGAIQPAAWHIKQDAQSLQFQYNAQAAEHVTLLSSLLFQEQAPRETYDYLGVLQSLTKVRRTQAKLGFVWDAQDDWDVAGGLEYLDEHYKGVVRTFPLSPLAYDQLSVASLYGEVTKHSDWGDFIFGARRDDHEFAGVVWSERFGYTKIMGQWHAKVMASRAERAPSVEDYSASATPRKNETVQTLEFETGYRVDADAQLTLDLFGIKTLDTLILRNQQSVHTRGLEALYQVRKPWGDASLSYSYYRACHTDTPLVQPIDFAVGSDVVDSDAHLAFANYKLVARFSYQFTDALSINPALTYFGPRWGYDVPEIAPATNTLREFPATTQLDITLFWRNAGMHGLDLSLGVFNALDDSAAFILPFRSTTPPLPDMGREFVLNAYFSF